MECLESIFRTWVWGSETERRREKSWEACCACMEKIRRQVVCSLMKERLTAGNFQNGSFCVCTSKNVNVCMCVCVSVCIWWVFVGLPAETHPRRPVLRVSLSSGVPGAHPANASTRRRFNVWHQIHTGRKTARKISCYVLNTQTC